MDDETNDYRRKPDSLRPVSAYLPNLTGPRAVAARKEEAEKARLATLRATRLFGCYRKDEAADPEVYLTGIVAIFMHYEPSVIEYVTDPYLGLPSSCKWLPTFQEVREACDKRQNFIDDPRARDRETSIRLQLKERAEREREEAERVRRPTIEEMKAKYGPTWGIGSSTKEGEAPRTKFDRYTPEQLRELYPPRGE